MKRPGALAIGCAGWSLPRPAQASFPGDGSHLERYARVWPAVEINSSFYRPHRVATYARWAASVPADFRFAVKIPKLITHEAKLVQAEGTLETFLTEVGGLGKKLGVLLVQLPPSLQFDATVARRFFDLLRQRHRGAVACEPRHRSWLEEDAESLLHRYKIARVAADPAPVAAAALPGGWEGLAYYRLHGSPKMYYSEYTDEFLARIAQDLLGRQKSGVPAWCIFDNTAAGHATTNALDLLRRTLPS